MFDYNIQNTVCRISGPVLLHQEYRNTERPFMFTKRSDSETADNNTRHDFHAGDEETIVFVNKKGHTQLPNKRKQARFLIAESEKELRYLFETYIDLLRFDSDIVDNGNRALSSFLQNKKNGKNYDAVILNTHLKGKRGLDVAREIYKEDNSQKIILVTTNTKKQFPKKELQSAGIDDKDILVMPFELSSLSKLLINDSSLPHTID